MANATLVVSGRIIDQEKVEKYKKTAIAVLKKYEGVFPPRTQEVTSILAGERKPKSILEIDFPSENHIKAAFGDEEYKSVVSLRNEAYQDLEIYITKKGE